MEKPLIQVGYNKSEMDFAVSASISDLSLEQLKELREMIIVAIWCAEDMWRRNHKEEAEQEDITKQPKQKKLVPQAERQSLN